MHFAATIAVSGLAVALALRPATASADPDTDKRIGTGLTAGAIAPVAGGVGLMYAASQTDDERLRVRLFAGGASTLVAGFGMFGTGIGFLGRSNASRRSQPWSLGRGAAAGFLVMGAVGLGLSVLGGYSRAFVEPGSKRGNRLRGLGLAGMIVGGNLAIFGTFLGAYTLGQASYDGQVPSVRVSTRGFMLSWSGLF